MNRLRRLAPLLCSLALAWGGCSGSSSRPERKEVQSTWPEGQAKVTLGFRGDSVFERLEHHENGQLKSRGQLLDGARHGVWNSYYDTGMPWSQVSYDRGEEHGAYRTYHPNGEPAIEGAFTQGQRIGTWTFYSPEGSLIKTEDLNGASPDPSL